MSTLLAHLATHFTGRSENLATAGLHFILERSAAARHAVAGSFGVAPIGGLPSPHALRFAAQSGDATGGIPDLVATDERERVVLIIESKFWAGLTDHQPLGYLERLAKDVPSVLGFVAPPARFETLWAELRRRCPGAIGSVQQRSELRWVEVSPNRFLALTTWRMVLGAIERAIEGTESHLASDLGQLRGLCEREDAEAFLPLRGEELSGGIGRRITQFYDLVDDVVTKLVSRGAGSVAGLKASGSRGRYMRNIRLHGNGCCLYFSAHAWAGRHNETPLWLKVQDSSWQSTAELRAALSPLELDVPSRLVVDGPDLFVPLFPRTQVERDAVIDDLVYQVLRVAELLPRAREDGALPPDQGDSLG